MALQSFFGSVVTDGTEQDLFDETALQHYATWIYLKNIGSGDSVQIRVFIQDPADSAAMEKYIDVLVSDAQSNPAFYIPWVPTEQYRVSVQRVGGSDTTITWCRKVQ